MSDTETASGAQDNTAAQEGNATTDTTATTTDTATTSTAAVDTTKADTTTKDTKTDETTADKAPLTVESYKDLKVAEGFSVDTERLTQLQSWAVKNQVPAEEVQGLVDQYCDALKGGATAAQAAEQMQHETWKNESIKIHGLKGIEEANRALSRFAEPEYIKWLQETGQGSNPAVVAQWRKVNSAISESGFIDGKTKGDKTNYYPDVPKGTKLR